MDLSAKRKPEAFPGKNLSASTAATRESGKQGEGGVQQTCKIKEKATAEATVTRSQRRPKVEMRLTSVTPPMASVGVEQAMLGFVVAFFAVVSFLVSTILWGWGLLLAFLQDVPQVKEDAADH